MVLLAFLSPERERRYRQQLAVRSRRRDVFVPLGFVATLVSAPPVPAAAAECKALR